MTSTVFQDFVTPVPAAWLNDINVAVYTALGNAGVAPTTAAQVVANLSLFQTTGGTVSGKITNTLQGDQYQMSTDTSPYRTGQWSVTASGSLYTLLGDFAMHYWTHNVAVDVNGNFLGRDAADPCIFYALTELGFIKIYIAANAAAGVVPTFSLIYSLDTNTGNVIFGGTLQATQLTSTIATGTAPIVVTSTTPVTNLNIGGNAATATNATNAATVTTTISSGAVATTQAITDNSTKVATTAFVKGLFTPITSSLGADVLLNNTANYFDGPSIAQGTSGTWFVSGQVTVFDTVAANMFAKLWDGTTVINSGASVVFSGSGFVTIELSGIITNPAGNLRISVKDGTATTGKIQFNTSGNSKDSTITAIRIG